MLSRLPPHLSLSWSSFSQKSWTLQQLITKRYKINDEKKKKMDGQNGEDRVKKEKNKRMKKANIEKETEKKETTR